MKLVDRQEKALAWALKASDLTNRFGQYQSAQLNSHSSYNIMNVSAQRLGFVAKINRSTFKWVGPKNPNILVGKKLVEDASLYWRQKDAVKKAKKANGKANGAIELPLEQKTPVTRLDKIEARLASLESKYGLDGVLSRVDAIEKMVNLIGKELE